MTGWLFLLAYACSGLAALVYEVTWTRLLTLYLGHTTAAASTVLAAFMGGIAGGSALGGAVAQRLAPRQALRTYAVLETAIGVLALLLPFELRLGMPLLSVAYQNGDSTLLFPVLRVVAVIPLVVVPALGLGATFPLAVRWFVARAEHPGRGAGALYAVNTAGAAVGAAAAGFFLVPRLGVFGTTLAGAAAGGGAALVALFITSRAVAPGRSDAAPQSRPARAAVSARRDADRAAKRSRAHTGPRRASQPSLAAAVLACTGFATFVYEIVWTRILGLLIGPSTYAFAATLTAIVTATAAGAVVGSAAAGRLGSPAASLALTLGVAAVAIEWAVSAAGALPNALISSSSAAGTAAVVGNILGAVWVIVPAAIALGVAFPLALEMAGHRDSALSRRLGLVYAVNTIAAVAGALLSGFVLLRAIGLEDTFRMTGAVVALGALLVIALGRLSPLARAAAMVPNLAAAGLLIWSAHWDRVLFASGAYKYARFAAPAADPEITLKAGNLLYYRDGAVATVSVKRLAGALSLAIDGKVDASTSADMLTQKLLAHLPLLLHGGAHDVCIIGLGSGVTLASALVHDIRAVDVVELSPEVVEASSFFDAANHHALRDPRTHLIVGDGRSHMLFSPRKYDVIISEPSNPWMAGVAALFTREFFTALRDHLAPGGVVCQWAHTYDISPADLRSVVATFASIFPNGTVWLVGEGDVLLVAAADPLEPRLANISQNWEAPSVAADLREVGATSPFSVYSLFVGGPTELRKFSGGARLQTDSRMALEFSGPQAVFAESATRQNAADLRALLASEKRPAAVADAFRAAGADQWRDRAAMMLKAGAYDLAYDDYAKALELAPTDQEALAGLVRSAVAARREPEAVEKLAGLRSAHPGEVTIAVAHSKMLAASGRFDEGVGAARDACAMSPANPAGWEQLASIFADVGDAAGLRSSVDALKRIAPERAATAYYSAAFEFLDGNLPSAERSAQEAIARDPNDAAAHNLLGAIFASAGRRDAARLAFEAALQLDRRDSATYTNLGLLALSSGNPQEAADRFLEALSVDPQSDAAKRGLRQAREQLPATH